jgi:hypothetical protein
LRGVAGARHKDSKFDYKAVEPTDAPAAPSGPGYKQDPNRPGQHYKSRRFTGRKQI